MESLSSLEEAGEEEDDEREEVEAVELLLVLSTLPSVVVAAAAAAAVVGVPSRRKIASSCPSSESPANSGRHVAISARTHPAAQTSTGVEYERSPRRSSGARYQSVTTSLV